MLIQKSDPCAKQAKVMKSLGFVSGNTAEIGVSLWNGYGLTLEFGDFDEVTQEQVLELMANEARKQGEERAREKIRQAIGCPSHEYGEDTSDGLIGP